MDDETREFMGFSMAWVIGIGVALLVVALIWAAASGTLRNLETQGVHQSVGYVESRNQHAREMIVVWNKAVDQGQKNATLIDICATANDIPAADVARDVAEFAKEECGK